MDEWSKRLSCDLHNLNKALEVACIDMFGKQGIGHQTPFQMIYLFAKILKTVRILFGCEGLNQAWGKTIQYLRDHASWQTTALDKCKHAFDDFMSKLQDLEEGDEKDFNKAVKLTTEAPSNLQDPVMTRWGTVLSAVELFADQWVVIYFFVQTLATAEDSSSYLKTLSCELLLLMHNQDMPQKGGTDNEGNIDNNETIEPESMLKKNF